MYKYSIQGKLNNIVEYADNLDEIKPVEENNKLHANISPSDNIEKKLEKISSNLPEGEIHTFYCIDGKCVNQNELESLSNLYDSLNSQNIVNSEASDQFNTLSKDEKLSDEQLQNFIDKFIEDLNNKNIESIQKYTLYKDDETFTNYIDKFSEEGNINRFPRIRNLVEENDINNWIQENKSKILDDLRKDNMKIDDIYKVYVIRSDAQASDGEQHFRSIIIHGNYENKDLLKLALFK